MSLYAELVAAECETDSHESDLYVKASPTARTIIEANGMRLPLAFISNTDGAYWYDLPFMFEPFWDRVSNR